MAEEEVDTSALLIAPLEKKMSKGAFLNEEPEFKHLTNWFRTAALLSQREKKCKVYVAQLDGKTVGYISISSHFLDDIPRQSNTTAHSFQVLLVGKLYVDPDYRGQHIGKKLMELAIDITQTVDEMVGCAGVMVDANNNPRTVKFYEDFGFEVIDQSTSDRTTTMFFRVAEDPVV